MKSEKKCTSCNHWSEWTGSTEDKCVHCGDFIAPVEREQKIKKEKTEKESQENWMFHYASDAPWHERYIKKSGYVVYSIIMAIVSFIMYLFFWLGP